MRNIKEVLHVNAGLTLRAPYDVTLLLFYSDIVGTYVGH
jgi:hypothetical protein